MKNYSSINLSYLVRYRNQSAAAFGADFEVPATTFRHWINGRNQIPVDKAFEIVDHFNITLDEFYRTELTESLLKSRDGYHLEQKKPLSSVEKQEIYLKKAQLGAADILQDMLDASVKRYMKEQEEKDKPSKAG